MSSPSRATFRLRQNVKWTSQAAGFATTKEGEIVLVVPPNKHPKDYSSMCPAKSKESLARNHESYIVLVDGVYYWPRVSALEVVEGPASASVSSEAAGEGESQQSAEGA